MSRLTNDLSRLANDLSRLTNDSNRLSISVNDSEQEHPMVSAE